MLKHKYLTRWEYFQLKFWGRCFVGFAKLRVRHNLPICIGQWFDKQFWKQLRKVPK